MTLPEKLRDIRLSAGITGAKMAQILGTSRGYVSQVEKGTCTISQEKIETWCNACGYSYATVTTWEIEEWKKH